MGEHSLCYRVSEYITANCVIRSVKNAITETISIHSTLRLALYTGSWWMEPGYDSSNDDQTNKRLHVRECDGN